MWGEQEQGGRDPVPVVSPGWLCTSPVTPSPEWRTGICHAVWLGWKSGLLPFVSAALGDSSPSILSFSFLEILNGVEKWMPKSFSLARLSLSQSFRYTKKTFVGAFFVCSCFMYVYIYETSSNAEILFFKKVKIKGKFEVR